jgi:hypothetical protein
MDLSTIRGVALLSETDSLAVNGGDILSGTSTTITKLHLSLNFHSERATARNRAFQLQSVVLSPGAETQQSNEQSAVAVA